MNEVEKAGVMLHGWNSSAMMKLQDLFNIKCEEVTGKSEDPEEDWILYLNKHDSMVLAQEDIVENFPHLVNFDSRIRSSVCIEDPCEYTWGSDRTYILVPREFAEKVLVLGHLP